MRPLNIDLRPRAELDVDDAFLYLYGQAGLDVAVRFHTAVSRAFDMLTEQPGIGARYPFRNPALTHIRRWVVPGFRNYLILYRVRADAIEIVRLLHGAQDLEALMADESLSD